MNFEKIDEQIKRNEEEIKKIAKTNPDRAKYLEEENRVLAEFKANYIRNAKELENLEKLETKDKDTKAKIKKIRSDMKESVKKVSKTSQGKLRSVFSSLIGQVDKRIHNFVFKETEKKNTLRDKLWNLHSGMVTKRYSSPLSYFFKNALIIGAVSFVTLTLPALIPALTGVMYAANIGVMAFAANTIVKTVSAVYNNAKYGGPLLERTKKIFKGSYIQNIRNAFYEKKATRNILGLVKGKGNVLGNPVRTSDSPKPTDTSAEEKKSHELTDEVKKAVDLINGVDLEHATLEELSSVIAQVKSVRDKLPKDALEKYNKIYAKAKMLFDEKNKKDNKDNKEGSLTNAGEDNIDNHVDEKPVETPIEKPMEKPTEKPVKKPKKELSLNELIASVDIEKMKKIISNNSVDQLDSKEKKQFYTQLLNVLSILRNVSSNTDELVEVDKKNLQKLIEISEVFKKDEEFVQQEISKAKYAMVDKVVVKLRKAERHTYNGEDSRDYYYSAECTFYTGRSKIGARYIPFENDDEFHIKSIIAKQFSGLTSDKIIIEPQYEKMSGRAR